MTGDARDLIGQDERLDALSAVSYEEHMLNGGGLFVIQKKRGFRLSSDTVLLVNFAAKKAFRRCLDIGSGSGAIPIILADRFKGARFDAIEIQEEYAKMARRSVALNGLGERVRVINCDANEAKPYLSGAQYDLIVCNPPYFKEGAVLPAQTEALRASRASGTLTPQAIARIAATYLQTAGRLCLVMPAPRLLETCEALRQSNIEPKRLQLVQHTIDQPPYLFLLESIRNANPGLHCEPTHIISQTSLTPADT